VRHIGIILFGFLVLSACRYGAPLLKFPKESRAPITTDSLGNKEYHRAWNFLCMRTGVHIGYFAITEYYDKQGRLKETEKYKDTWVGCCDCPNRWITKEIYYDTLGHRSNVHYSVVEDGWGSSTILDKTDYYKNGKKVGSTEPKRKQVITLHPDTTDKYVIVFRCDTPDGPSYNILMGYSVFKNAKGFVEDDSKKFIINTIDKYIKNKTRDTIVLNADTMHWFIASDVDSWIGMETEGAIQELMDSGNVKVYDVAHKKYLKQVLKRKERWRSHGCFERHGISWFYRDVKTHKEITSYEIDDKRIIRARF
jgi:hypothetical protein